MCSYTLTSPGRQITACYLEINVCILYTFCILKYKLFVSCSLFILCFCSLSVASWFLEQTKKTEPNKLFVGRFNILPDLMSFPSMWRVWRWISSCFSRSLKSHSALKSTLRTALYIKYFPVLLSSILFSGTVQHPRELGGLPFSSPLADRCCCIWVAGAGTCTRCPSLSSPSLLPSLLLRLIRCELMSCRCLFSQYPSDRSARWRRRRVPSLFFITY